MCYCMFMYLWLYTTRFFITLWMHWIILVFKTYVHLFTDKMLIVSKTRMIIGYWLWGLMEFCITLLLMMLLLLLFVCFCFVCLFVCLLVFIPYGLIFHHVYCNVEYNHIYDDSIILYSNRFQNCHKDFLFIFSCRFSNIYLLVLLIPDNKILYFQKVEEQRIFCISTSKFSF